MKPLVTGKKHLVLALAVLTAAGCASQGQEPPQPPTPATAETESAQPPTEPVLPPNIEANSPTAQVIKLVQAGVDIGMIKNFVTNSAAAFELDADTIIALNDAGVPTEVINAMMDHDKQLTLAGATPPPPVTNPTVNTEPPTEPVTVNYFYDSLSPYGSWVDIAGYGRCWRPTVVIYDSGWRPYCDRGRWVYTDCGWYWDSDYSWGVTFHYGRWFRDDRFGWCWYPDTVWGPSWVTFRSSGDYCGWAPLPPLAVFRPGAGFFYRGASVSVGFDFGLGANCFTFVAPSHFCDRHPRTYCVDERRVTQVFQHTTVVNNYTVNRTTIVNNGIPVTRVDRNLPHPIRPVQVASLPNAERQGWRGDNHERNFRPGVPPNRMDSPRENTGNRPPLRGNDNNGSFHRQGTPTAPGVNIIGAPVQRVEPANNSNRQQPGRDNRDNRPTDHQSGLNNQQNQNAQNLNRTFNRTESPARPAVSATVKPAQTMTLPPRTVFPSRESTPNMDSANNRRGPTENNLRPSRNVESPINSAPAARSTPPVVEQRQYPPPVQNREPNVDSRAQNRIESTPRAVETTPRYSPPAQSQNSSRNADRGADRSDRGNSQRSDKDRNK